MDEDSSELFELCKEVHGATGWKGRDQFITTIGGKWIADHKRGWYDETIASDGFYPLYTSDYLLEKLPKFSPVAKDAYLTVIEKQTPKDKREDFYWTAGYFTGHGWSYTGQSDTPLKALLKLTLALHEANQLPPNNQNLSKGGEEI